MLKIFNRIYWFVQSLFGWRKAPEEGVIVGLPSPDVADELIDRFLPTENILAYTLVDDPFIYIAEGQEEVVASQLDAQVNGDVWLFQENGKEVKREKKVTDISIHDYMISMVATTVLKGWRCEPLGAGSWVSFFSRKRGWNGWKYKVIMQYKTTVDGHWCRMDNRRQCQTVWNTYTGEYRRRRNGRWVTTRETHRLSSCTQ